jgi:hypothetical protein
VVSLRKCRDILGSNHVLTDSQIEALRDEMVALANVMYEEIGRRQENGALSAFDAIESLASPEQRIEIEERAAIREIDGRLSRARAEALALCEFNGNRQPISDNTSLQVICTNRRKRVKS